MKVLLVHPSAEMYGADRMFLETVRAVAARGWACEVALPAEGRLTDALRDEGVTVRTLDVPVLRKPLMSPTGVVRFAAGCAAALPVLVRRIRADRPTVVYVSTVTSPLWLLAARLCRVPSVCHVHEAEESVPKPVRLALAAPLLLAKTVVANSSSSRQALLAELSRLAARTLVIYNGVQAPLAVVPVRERLAAPARLVLVGRISPRKGTDLAVEAVHLLLGRGHDVTLDLVGGTFAGYEWFVDAVRRRVAELGLDGRVRWRGERPDAYGELAGSDIALVPSRVEPFGNTAVEALLAGRPLVATAAQGLVEVVRPGPSALLVAPDDAEGLAAGVEHLLAHWATAVAAASDQAAQARERYSPQRYRDDLAQVLESAASRV